MYLKKIKMVGFKSFINPTEIEFSDKINGIVGPNGSGKSNIVDAIRWVLGEQSVKSLRGDGQMSDIIFSGSKTRKPASFASVQLTFDNKDRYLNIDTDEVLVKRTIYKNGDGEYKINNAKCKLKDITNLFTDTGASKESFNIISQGDIGNILSTKPEDRRIIFEDAAGTLKYKKRKEEALKKLDKTNDNLIRINDIILENEERLKPLKEQKEKAKIYLDNKKELEDKEISLIVNDIDNYNYKYQNSKSKIEELQNKISKIISTTSLSNAKIEKSKTKITNLNNDLYNKQKELVQISTKLAELSGKKNLLNERSKYKSDDIKLHNNIINLKEDLLKVNNEINLLNENINIDNNDIKELNNKLNNINLEIDKLSNNKTDILNNISIKTRENEKLKSRRNILENDIENNSLLPLPVRNILNNPKLVGICGIVGKLFETEEKYVVAINTALSYSSSYIITENTKDAEEAIKFLKDNKYGRATFYPLSVIKPRNIDLDSYNKIKYEYNFVDIASNLIKYDIKYKNIYQNLLGNTIIMKDLESANKISKLINNKYKIVTLDGNIVNAGGSITGGSVKSKTNILNAKYELEDVIKKINNINDELSILEDNINIIDNKYSDLEKNKNDILFKLNTKTNILKERNNKKDELLKEQNNINEELNSNKNIVNNILNDEENNIINEYYNTNLEKDKINLQIEEILKKIDEEKDNLSILETNLKVNNKDYNNYQDELKKNEILVNKLDVKLDNLVNDLQNEYQITYEKAKENYILDDDSEVVRSRVIELKRIIKSLGVVNVSAIDEYEEVNKRYTFLTNQKNDLIHAKDMLLDIIKEMDEVMKDKMLKTFNQIQVEFKETFRKLFGGGDAKLKLTDEKDILNTGIEIIALPPGKKLTSISLLSGGEKTLTAIALLFSILNIRPVPFCVLDEVEAALDEVNVENFGKYLLLYKNKTEFIIITHKKKTMEYADVLYGITMQESGVSKLVSVKLEDIKN